MQCDLDLQDLALKDVHSSRAQTMIPNTQDGFQLEQPSVFLSCLTDVFNATEMFCTLPDNDFLDAGMCSPLLQTNVPQSFYERTVRGELQHPDDMVAIWEGPNLAAPSTLPWIDVPILNPMHADLPSGDYVGFKAVANDILQDIAVANNSATILLVENGQALQNDTDGLLRPIPNLVGANGQTQSAACNASGKIRSIIFLSQAWCFMNNAWQKTQNSVGPDVQYQNVKIWETSENVYLALLFITPQASWGVDVFKFKDNVSNPLSALTPIFHAGQDGAFRAGFLLLSPNNSFLICSTFVDPSDTMKMHLIDVADLNDPVQYDKWAIQDFLIGNFLETSPDPFRGEAVCTGDLASPYLQCAAVLGRRLRLQFQLHALTGLVTDVSVIQEAFQVFLRLRDNTTHTQRLSVLNGEILTDAMWSSPLVISNQLQSFALDDVTSSYIWAISPDATDVWIFRDGKLFRLHTTNPPTYGTAWTQTFNLYQADSTKVSDFGLPSVDKSVWMPAATRWFLGTNTLDTPIPLQTAFPVEVARSPHQSFRYEMQRPVQDTNPLTFLYAVCKLQRANELELAQHTVVTLQNNANVVMRTHPTDTVPVWQNRLNDVDSPDPLVANVLNLLKPPFGVVSPNGQWWLYVSRGVKLRLVCNMYNGTRFGDWAQDEPSRFDRAILMQQNLCWNAMKQDEATNPTGFIDPRCKCIGGDRLFQIVFPGAEQVPQGLLAPAEVNLPCLTQGCTDSFSSDTIFTNVKRYYQDRCSGRSFALCQSALEIAANTKLVEVDFIRTQNCTTSIFLQCDSDHQCGPGMTCFNARCTAACNTSVECHQFSGNTFTACVQGHCQQALNPKPASIWTPLFITVLVVGLVFVAILLLLFGLLGRRAGQRI